KVSMMRIVRSTSSCASAGESNEAREAMRSGAVQAKGVVLPDDDGVSPNPARGELVSASLNHSRRPSSQETRSLPSTGEKRKGAPAEPVRSEGSERMPKEPPRYPGRSAQAVACGDSWRWECITIDGAWMGVGWARSSEEAG